MLKKYLSFILTAVVLSFCINRLYEYYLRPESLFFKDCLRASTKWNESLRQDAAPCYIFSGGSEVRMAIEPQVMLEKHGVKAVNVGLQAGNGVRCNTQIALSFLRKGDTLLLSYIPGNYFLKHDGVTHKGINFCYDVLDKSAFFDGIIPVSAYSVASLIRGDVSNYTIHLLRLLMRPDCIYRYACVRNARITPSGHVEIFLTNEQHVVLDNSPAKDHIAFDAKNMMAGWKHFLEDLKKYCSDNGINLAIYISRAHYPERYRKINAAVALFFIDMGIPVVKDAYLGCCSDTSHFSDTFLHLSAKGSKVFSEFLAEQLKNKEYWNKSELHHIISSH